MDEDGKIALYRIAQEALTNIERHAGASRVAVDLRGHRKGATLRITDNGVGLGRLARDPASGGGLGLRNMQERVEQLGGQLRIESAPGGGTTIDATVPLTHMLPPEEENPDAPASARQDIAAQ
ncbi:MAG: hypothetical protein CML61_08620 [Rhodobacteraceae bacterium]|nr:hypothetical protein [Paracoccaceae bacterium]